MEYDLFGNIIEERIPRPKQKNIKNITKDLHGLADNGFEGYEANDEELIALYEAVESLHLRLNEIQNLKKAVENNGFSKQISFKNEELRRLSRNGFDGISGNERANGLQDNELGANIARLRNKSLDNEPNTQHLLPNDNEQELGANNSDERNSNDAINRSNFKSFQRELLDNSIRDSRSDDRTKQQSVEQVSISTRASRSKNGIFGQSLWDLDFSQMDIGSNQQESREFYTKSQTPRNENISSSSTNAGESGTNELFNDGSANPTQDWGELARGAKKDKDGSILLSMDKNAENTQDNEWEEHDIGTQGNTSELLIVSSGTNEDFIATNYEIPSGKKEKFYHNITAIKLAKELSEIKAKNPQRFTITKQEQEIISKFSGFGGLAEVFDEDKEQWQKERNELKEVLSQEEYAFARASVYNAFYTPKIVIDTIYKSLDRMGLKDDDNTKKFLEPSAGNGAFLANSPYKNCSFMAIEKDLTTYRILDLLYPQQTTICAELQAVDFTSRDKFDAVIGNPPYSADVKIRTEKDSKLNGFRLHDYFSLKSQKLLKEGGINAFVTSTSFLDNPDPEARIKISENSTFIAAVRLPEGIFKSSGTQVPTDIVFFQEGNNIDIKSFDWLTSSAYEMNTSFKLNDYFQKNPQNILGKIAIDSGQFGRPTLTCKMDENIDIQKELDKFVNSLPSDIYKFKDIEIDPAELILNSQTSKQYQENQLYFNALPSNSFVIYNNAIYTKINDKSDDDMLILKKQEYGKELEERIKNFVDLRDKQRVLIDLEKTNILDNDEKLIRARNELNKSYDNYHATKYKTRNGMKVAYVDYLHNRTNNRVLKADPSFARVEALEKNYKKAVSEQEAKKLGIEPQDESAIKASILHTRIIKPQSTTTFSNPVEGLMACMNLYGEPRIDFIAQKLGKSEFDVANELIKEEQIFIDHRMLSTKGESKYIFAPKYLSGDVKRKLKEVEVVAQDYPNEMSHNIKALKGVIPEDIKAGDIEFEMGAPWIPIEYYNQFFEQKFNANRSIWNLSRTKFSGEWNFKGNKNQLPWKIQNEYGLDGNGRSPFDVGLKALENGFFEIMKEGEGYEVDKYGNIKMDKNGNAIKEKIPDPETSAILNSKVERLKGEFKEWLMQDRDRRIDVAQIYNDKFNCYAKTKYDGSFLTLEGLNTSFELRKHQKNAIFRAINDRVCLFDHEVGAGKTLTSICSVMKQKELGIVNKPLFIVPNHLVDQWKNEFFNAYPDANLLIADEKSTSKENKEEFLGRIMADNYDAIIMKHSQFFDISAPAKIRQQIIEQELAELRDVLERKAEDENASRQTIKQIEKRIDNAEERLKELSSMDNKTKMLDFSDLGIDCLVVDESHMFKNLRFSTALKVKGLGNQAGSRKASDLLEKTTWMHENNKKVIFLTGTPISNSLSELYNLNKFLIPDEIEKKEINSFDGWVSSFAQIQLSPELDASAQRYKIVQRLSGLKNLPETCSMYMSYADIVTNADIMQDYTNYVPSVNINKVVSPISKEQEFYIGVMDENTKEFNTGSIIYRMEHMPKDPREDNFLKCTGDAKKAGLDFRLIAPSAKDNKNSKLNKCVENTLEVYKQWEKEKGTQLIFLDSGTPKTSNQLSTKLIIDDTQSTPEATKENDFININDAMNSDENVSDDFDSEAGEDRAEAKETFFLYGDLYKKLVEAGIPRHEIAFIHDTESSNAKKAELFNKVNAGEVRILIGSTAKMGAGTNVQERVVAIHHLDCPWRPSDFVQRNGRVIRQGNKLFERSPENFKIQEFRYVTEKTYDAVSWQIIETKSKSLVNFRKGLVDGRSLSGFEEEAASAAEMKAIATGNPLLILQVKLKTTLDKEEALFRGFQNSYQNNEDELISLEAKLQNNKKYIKNLENIKTFMDKNPMNSVFDCTIHGKEERRYVILNDDSEATKEKQKQMREHFSKAIRSVIDNRLDNYLLCSYNNLQIKATWNDSVRGIVFSLENIENDIKLHPGNLVYDNMGSKRFELEPISVNGFFTRVKNNIDLEKIAENITRSNNSLQETENSIKSAKIWLEENKEYKKMPYLKALRDENKEILSELAKMSNNKNYQSNFKSELFDDEGNEKHQKQREPASPQTEQQSMRCR